MTLTSMKLKKAEDIKGNVISRYIIDEQTKAILTKTDA